MIARRVVGRAWPFLALSLGLGFLYVPLLVIAIKSVNTNLAVLPIERLSLDSYRVLLTDERFGAAASYSLKIAALSTLVATTLGTAAAIGINRSRGRLAAALGAFCGLPLLVPNLVVGLVLAIGFRTLNVPLSLWTVMVGHVVINAPLAFVIVLARLNGFDWSLVEAARLLGASSRVAFLRVTVPLLAPAIVGSAVLLFAISLDNFYVSLFLSGQQSTIPLFMWSQMRSEISPAIDSIGTLLLLVTLVAALLAERLTRWRTS